jgi:hypothetical protein
MDRIENTLPRIPLLLSDMRAVAQQWTTFLGLLFQLLAIMSQYVIS